jgi:hypothetical protein
MSLVVLQPCGNQGSREHYRDTIENKVPLETLQRHINSADFRALQALCPSEEVAVWGVTPGKTGQNLKKWTRMNPGDVMLFAKDGGFFSLGTLAYKCHSESCAVDLWGRDEAGQTWEYIYFLEGITEFSQPYSALNKAVGYAENNIVQGFTVLDEQKSIAALEWLESVNMITDIVEPEAYQASLTHLDSLDAISKSSQRKEQSFLRRALFGSPPYDHKVSNCSICGEGYPVEFLVTAHVKKRSLCSDLEKRDVEHIVAPMCKFGCDELYEKGYLKVDSEGRVYSDRVNNAKPVNEYISRVSGRACASWSKNSEPYFSWHRTFHSS